MMRENPLKAKLKAGETMVGSFHPIPAPGIVELYGLVGFDFVIVDAEHGPASVETLEAQVRAADVVNLPVVVRIAENTPQNILRHLDTGVLGVQLPMVNTAEQARAVVAAVKYPPVGRRGLAGVRANGYGLLGTLGDYTRLANDNMLVSIQIETQEAIDHLDEILKVDGIDLVFIGPNDLATSLGYPGESANPRVLEVIDGLVKRIHAGGRASGITAYDSAGIARAKSWKIQFILGGTLPLLINASRSYLKEVRDGI